MSDQKDSKKYRRMKDRGRARVHPDNSSYENSAYEMDSVEEEKANNKKTFKIENTVNALNFVANIKAGASRWRRYATNRRRVKHGTGSGDGDGLDRKRTGGLGLEYDVTSHDVPDGVSLNGTQKQIIIAHNRNLIEYFAKLAQSKDDSDCVNLEFVESLLKNGARIDCTDKYGQTVFHEVARAWHVDVAKFLVECGAKINQGDNFGRTPLHVASAVDYPEMVNFLIENGANKESLTKGEHQTPVHFAARNDACASLKALLKQGCKYKEIRDHKGRTPLHVAAELDRSETARLLLELDDPAPAGVTDNSGQSAIVWMINKMPPVAKVALDQFHTTDRANRRQYYHLHKLEPRKPGEFHDSFPQSAMQVIINHKQHDLILHASITRLIRNKWRKFGARGAWISILINFLFIALWTAQGIAVEYDKRYLYILPQQWWRILLFVLALLLTIYQLEEELREFFCSRKAHRQWKEWREKEIDKDIEYTHPRWPEEKAYLKQEQQDLDDMRPQYFNDFWNIYDWICYTFLVVVIITHLVDVFNHTNFIARLHIRIMAVTIILLWTRLMKNVRAFSYLGPFIVMLVYMLNDITKFLFLYLVFYLPYAFAFWMLFGENKVPEEYQGLPGAENYTVTVNGFGTWDALFFSLFRITLVDDYDYDGMKKVDYVMADILVGTWLAISAVLMLNLLIALLSDTFQRVHDNAKANAVMQRAIFILNYEESMDTKRREKFRQFIHTSCAPEEDFYDDDTTDSGSDDLKKVAFQIKDQLAELQEILEIKRSSVDQNQDQLNELGEDIRTGKYHHNNLDDDTGGGDDKQRRGKGVVTKEQLKKFVTTKKLEQEIDVLRDDVQAIRDTQEQYMGSIKKEIIGMKGLLQQLVLNQAGASPASITSMPPFSRHPSVVSAGHVTDLQQTYIGATGLPSGGVKQSPLSSLQSSMTRQGSMPPTRGTMLSATQEEDDWEQSEKRRKQELEDLRRQLTERARASLTDYPTADARQSITPNSTTEPNGFQAVRGDSSV